MGDTDRLYWPFNVVSENEQTAFEGTKTQFLQEAFVEGYRPFRFGSNDYGAESETRGAFILERGQARWEIRLGEGGCRVLLAYVEGFESASTGVLTWLRGSSVDDVIKAIAASLVTPPGARTSHIIGTDAGSTLDS
jgi:hypothetical protein